MTQETVIFILVLILTAGGFVTLLAVFLYSLLSPNKVKERLSRYVETPPEEVNLPRAPSQRREKVSSFRNRLNNILLVFAGKNLYRRLQSSNWQITVTEYVMIQILSAILGLILGWVITKFFLIGIVFGILLYMLPGFFLYRSIFQRQKKFQNQLVDVLVLIRGSVQAGFSLLQSLEVVVKEMPAPASEEFGRVQREVQFGIPLSQALVSLSDRMESDDLQMVVTAIIINSQVGGNLSVMLTAVTETIRNRIALFGEVRALTSNARFTSYILTLLPFITALAVVLLSPGYFSETLDSPITKILFGFALVGIIIGNIWLRRIANIKV